MFIGQIQKLVGRVAPWFLHGKNIGRFLESFGATMDAGVVALDTGLRLSQPLRCDVSALPVLSKDRKIRLYPTESLASKRFRLSQWLQLHRTRACHAGELKHSQPYFLPDTPVMRIVHQDGDGTSASWWTIEADGSISFYQKTPSNWFWGPRASNGVGDNGTTKWSRFWVILYAPASFLAGNVWDDGSTWDNGFFWDGLSSSQVAKDLVDMILEWKAPHSRLAAYIIATDPASFDPTASPVTSPQGWTTLPAGNWGCPLFTGGGVAHATRLPTAHFIYEDPST
jgi:hypothetical protein